MAGGVFGPCSYSLFRYLSCEHLVRQTVSLVFTVAACRLCPAWSPNVIILCLMDEAAVVVGGEKPTMLNFRETVVVYFLGSFRIL